MSEKKKPLQLEPEGGLSAFESSVVRRTWYEGQWWFAIVDVVAALTDSQSPEGYLKDLRRRDKGLAEGWGQIATPLRMSTPGGVQALNCANVEGVLRVIQSIPSPKAEPFKTWLAQVGYERMQQLHASPDIESLSEAQRRLMLRNELTLHNKHLAAAARNAGVETPIDYAVFQDHGYKGLYGGLGAKDIHTNKGLKKSQKILDHMGSTELAANLFCATQAEEKLRRDGIQGKTAANKTHHQVGRKVRQTIEELGGTMPENLPAPDKSIQQLGVCAAEGASAATRDKPASCGTTSCAQGATLGLSVAPHDPRFSRVSLRCLLPRRLLEREKQRIGKSTPGATDE